MNIRRRVGLEPVDRDGSAHALAQEIVSHPHTDGISSSSTLPEELVDEILLRVPPDEPAHLVRAAIVCKAWHSIISDNGFRRRYRRFHGAPPLQGYICNQLSDSTVRFVPRTTLVADSPVLMSAIDCDGKKPSAMDCRHGRVLIQTEYYQGLPDQLIVWDLIAGSRHHLSVPFDPQYSDPDYAGAAGAVLCAKNGCDHLDCHGGPFLVVLLGMHYDDFDEDGGVHTWATVYSSDTGAWSAPTTPNERTNKYIHLLRPSLFIGDALYFTAGSGGHDIVKYDLHKHELSVIHQSVASQPTLTKGDDGGLGVAAILCNRIYMWSWQPGNKDAIGGWVKSKELELDDTLLPKGVYSPYLMCIAEGTNTVFIGVDDTGVFTLDLNSRQVRKVGETDIRYHRPILPYMSYYTPKYEPKTCVVLY